MTRWQDLTEDQRNELIASTFFGWKPVQCDGDKAYVFMSDYNAEMCRRCYASTDDWQAGKLVHGIIPVERAYTSDVALALQVAEKAQEHWKGETSLNIRLQPHGVHRYLVDFRYPVLHVLSGDPNSVYTSIVETRIVRDDCNLDDLAETICFVLAQAMGIIQNESERED